MQPTSNEAAELITGTVASFSDNHGYGYIQGDDGQRYFVYYAGICGQTGRKCLMPGQRVQFQLGTMAVKCRVIENPRGLASYDGRTA